VVINGLTGGEGEVVFLENILGFGSPFGKLGEGMPFIIKLGPPGFGPGNGGTNIFGGDWLSGFSGLSFGELVFEPLWPPRGPKVGEI